MTFWFKAFHGMAYDIQWKVIADALRTQPDKVFCVWFALLDYASMNTDRGSVEGFDPAVCKVAFGYKIALVEKILDELTLRGLLTDDNRIANWEMWQGQNKPTDAENSSDGESKLEQARRKNRERQQRFRSRRACEANCDAGSVACGQSRNDCANNGNVTGNADSNVTHNVTHNVTDNVTDEDGNVTGNALYREDIDIEKNREDLSPLPPGGRNVTGNVTADNVTSAPEPAAEPEQATKPSMPSRRKDDFVAWYNAYPRKRDRDEAVKAWDAACKAKRLPPLAELLETLSWQKESHDWTKEDGRWIPYPGKYLRAGSWQDEKPTKQPARRRYYGPDANGRTPYVNEDEQDFSNVPRNADGGVDWAQVMGGAK